ncbi:MAG TPA: nitroreductase family protein [Spirochaetota bacterium]|nr:nitroreductase family protein [Spirochaetota bacterium]
MKDRPGKTIKTGFGDEPARPSIDYCRCTSCGLCARVCKSFTILDVDGRPEIFPDNGLGCIGCAQCMLVCPRSAISVTGRGVDPEYSFPLPKKNERASLGALYNLLASRRSVREFSDRPVEKASIEKIISVASTAPMGLPPSDVGVVAVMSTERVWELAGDICGIFKKWLIFDNPVIKTLAVPFMKKTDAEMMEGFVIPALRAITEARSDTTDYLFYHAPCVLLFHQSPYADPVDGSIACTYAMTAAEAIGLGSCMIGTVSFAINREKRLKRKWGIPDKNSVSLAMILGYPAFRYSRGIRRSFASVQYL